MATRSASTIAAPAIKSGNYGQPPKGGWWLKQSLIFFLGLIGIKLFVFFLFAALPWLAWVGDWALRWTEGSESLQVAFVMFIFPLAMNMLQYYIIDAFIKDSAQELDRDGYQTVHSGENSSVEEDEHGSRRDVDDGLSSDDADEPKAPKTTTKETSFK